MGSAEWREPLESGRVYRAVTVRKKTKEKERYTGCQNRRSAKNAKTQDILSILNQKWSKTLLLRGGGVGSAAWGRGSEGPSKKR